MTRCAGVRAPEDAADARARVILEARSVTAVLVFRIAASVRSLVAALPLPEQGGGNLFSA